MKKLAIISVLSLSALLVVSCGNDSQSPGHTYMPDMDPSRAYETYSDNRELIANGYYYDKLPVPGTINRGEELPYHLKNDSAGYAASYSYPSPLRKLTDLELAEADRLYQINCAICHGSKLDGNGPLYNGGAGPYAAKPATLVGDPNYLKITEGSIYHVTTYGKGMMGSYASQLNRRQRWMIAQYIKNKQAGGSTTTGNASDSAMAAPTTGDAAAAGATNANGTN